MCIMNCLRQQYNIHASLLSSVSWDRERAVINSNPQNATADRCWTVCVCIRVVRRVWILCKSAPVFFNIIFNNCFFLIRTPSRPVGMVCRGGGGKPLSTRVCPGELYTKFGIIITIIIKYYCPVGRAAPRVAVRSGHTFRTVLTRRTAAARFRKTLNNNNTHNGTRARHKQTQQLVGSVNTTARLGVRLPNVIRQDNRISYRNRR